MKIYNYDDNGIFINEGIADESPLEPGVSLIPANATTAEPLERKDGFYIKFNSETTQVEQMAASEPNRQAGSASTLPAHASGADHVRCLVCHGHRIASPGGSAV